MSESTQASAINSTPNAKRTLSNGMLVNMFFQVMNSWNWLTLTVSAHGPNVGY